MDMAKLILVVFLIQFTLVITGVAAIPGSSIYNLLTNPTDWSASDFLNTFSLLLLATGGVAVIVGTIVTRSDIFIFSGIAAIFLSFGIGLGELWTIIAAQSNYIIATFFVAPILLIYIVTVIAWWRGRA